MGKDVENEDIGNEDFDYFLEQLTLDTKALGQWFEEDRFEKTGKFGGIELEAWMIGKDFYPTAKNEILIKQLNHPHIVPELSRFNLEFNVTPLPLENKILSHFREDLDQYWKNCNACAENLDAQMIMIGILPTVRPEDLNLKNMSPVTRYRALNEQVMALRKGKPIKLDIRGKENLKITHYDVMLESAATSLQIHLSVDAHEALRFYNASLICASLMVGLGSNSPFLFHKNLYAETRIPLFEQSVSVSNLGIFEHKIHDRVFFANRYIEHSLMECFWENLERYPVFLPMLKKNDKHDLKHLRLHNGTIWRWIRPLIGFDKNGKPHIRIEHRVLPAGPTLIDSIANIAFYLGIVQTLATQEIPPEKMLSFHQAKENFYQAARNGLNANIKWFHGKKGDLTSLLTEEILPMAKKGLQSLEIDPQDINTYIDILNKRVEHKQNGSIWQERYIQKNSFDFQSLTAAYLKNQNKGDPVHTWPYQAYESPKISQRKVDPKEILHIIQEIPEGFLDVSAKELYQLLPGPTLIELEGKRKRPLFVSVLLHGNETTSFQALQIFLKEQFKKNRPLPRSLSIFVGNVFAAKENCRRLENQLDFNRVWNGGDQPEQIIAQKVLKIMERKNIFASIDIHNNTGKNPHFACINIQKEEFFQLALLFSKKVVYFTNPDSVLSYAFSRLCPSVVLECGRPGTIKGVEEVTQYLSDCIRLSEISNHAVSPQDIDFFESVARIEVPKDQSIGFGEKNRDRDFCFLENLDHFNFMDLPEHTVIGWKHKSNPRKLLITDCYKNDISDKYFYYEENEIRTRVPLIPSMFTLDKKIVRQDCLGYVMSKKPVPIRKKKIKIF